MRSILFKHIPNIFTFIRIICIIIGFILLIINNNSNIALILIIVGALTDLIDGKIARKFKLETKFGAVLDQFADTVFTILLILAAILLGKTVVVLFIFIEVPRVILYLLYRFKTKQWLEASKLAKIKTASLFITLIILIFSIRFEVFVPVFYVVLLPNLIIQTVSTIDCINTYFNKIENFVEKC